MPVEIIFLDNGAGIEFKASGTVTGEEIIEANNKVTTYEVLSRLKYKIADRTACTEYLVNVEEIKTIAHQEIQASKINKNITIVLVSRTDLQFGMTRMWQALSSETGFKSEIFKDRQSADKYINETFKKD